MTASSARLDRAQPSRLSTLRSSARNSVMLRRSHCIPVFVAGEPAAGAAGRGGPGAALRDMIRAQAELLQSRIHGVPGDPQLGPRRARCSTPSARAPPGGAQPHRLVPARPRSPSGAPRPSPPSPSPAASPGFPPLITAASANNAARSIAFPSSRMFPGHSYASSRACAVGIEPLGRQPVLGAGAGEELLGQQQNVVGPGHAAAGDRASAPPGGGRGPPGTAALRTAARRSALVALISQTSVGSERVLPRRRTARSSIAVSSLACKRLGQQRRSRRERAPRRAPSETARAWPDGASVNAPRSKPNSSASSSVSGIAAQLTSTKGPRLRAPWRWSSRATNPLPVPVSPWMRTGGSRCPARCRSSSRRSLSRTISMARLSPSELSQLLHDHAALA